MEITSITFRRKCNTGQFESFDVEATAAVPYGADAVEMGRHLQAYVDQVCQERIQLLRKPGAKGGVDAGEFPFDEPR
jgi:hypothetical protein